MMTRRSERASVLPVTDGRGQRWRLAGMLARDEEPMTDGTELPAIARSDTRVGDIMTAPAAYCTPTTDLERVAALMIYNRCGALPAVESEATMTVVGIVTDRDIVCRALGQGRDALTMTAGECMTERVATIGPEQTLAACCDAMRAAGVRRLPVVDPGGRLLGMITLADIARHAAPEQTGALMRDIARTPYPFDERRNDGADAGLPSL